MIDIENKVIDTIEQALIDSGITATVSSTFIETPSDFPWVYGREMGNSTYKGTLDTSLFEHHANIDFRWEVYSNKTSGAKTEVKEILNIIDLAMQKMKFTRSSYSFIPNIDRSVTRAYADYSAVVQQGFTEEGNVIHRMYRG